MLKPVRQRRNRTPEKAIRHLEKLAARMKGPDTVRVGFPQGTNDYPDGTNTIMVGAVHEFGSPARGIPQRSYLRSTLKRGTRKYRSFFKKVTQGILDGKHDKVKALGLVGLRVETDVKDKITDLKDPPLKYREGNPLVDTGHLRQSVTHEVGE